MTQNVSRRDLLGAGLLRRARERADEQPAPPQEAPPADWGTGPRVAAPGAAEAVTGALGDVAGRRVVVPEGPGALAERLAAAGAGVSAPACATPRLPLGDGQAHAIASCFGAVRAGRVRAVAGELHRVLAPGGVLAMAVWRDAGRWGSYDGLVYALTAFAWFAADEHEDWLLVTAQR